MIPAVGFWFENSTWKRYTAERFFFDFFYRRFLSPKRPSLLRTCRVHFFYSCRILYELSARPYIVSSTKSPTEDTWNLIWDFSRDFLILVKLFSSCLHAAPKAICEMNKQSISGFTYTRYMSPLSTNSDFTHLSLSLQLSSHWHEPKNADMKS